MDIVPVFAVASTYKAYAITSKSRRWNDTHTHTHVPKCVVVHAQMLAFCWVAPSPTEQRLLARHAALQPSRQGRNQLSHLVTKGFCVVCAGSSLNRIIQYLRAPAHRGKGFQKSCANKLHFDFCLHCRVSARRRANHLIPKQLMLPCIVVQTIIRLPASTSPHVRNSNLGPLSHP